MAAAARCSKPKRTEETEQVRIEAFFREFVRFLERLRPDEDAKSLAVSQVKSARGKLRLDPRALAKWMDSGEELAEPIAGVGVQLAQVGGDVTENPAATIANPAGDEFEMRPRRGERGNRLRPGRDGVRQGRFFLRLFA